MTQNLSGYKNIWRYLCKYLPGTWTISKVLANSVHRDGVPSIGSQHSVREQAGQCLRPISAERRAFKIWTFSNMSTHHQIQPAQKQPSKEISFRGGGGRCSSSNCFQNQNCQLPWELTPTITVFYECWVTKIVTIAPLCKIEALAARHASKCHILCWSG